jgi:RecB family exonuclease
VWNILCVVVAHLVHRHPALAGRHDAEIAAERQQHAAREAWRQFGEWGARTVSGERGDGYEWEHHQAVEEREREF